LTDTKNEFFLAAKKALGNNSMRSQGVAGQYAIFMGSGAG